MKNPRIRQTALAVLCGASLLAAGRAWAAPLSVSLYAKQVTITMPDGVTVPMWGFAANAADPATVPGPQINVDPTQFADGLEVTVYNVDVTEPVSLVIPGLNGSQDAGQPVKFPANDPNYPNRVRSLVPEVAPGASRLYRWVGPLNAGTYPYVSGSHQAVQVQMGLYGMVTVRQAANEAYPGIVRNTEVPVVLSEIDTALHAAVQAGTYGPAGTITSTIRSEPSYFLINGQAHDPAGSLLDLPNPGQVGQAALFRIVNVCNDTRIVSLGGPFPSAAGNYLKVIAEDGSPYPFPKNLYGLAVPAMKSIDFTYTPTVEGSYRLFDRLGRSNGTQPNGGMIRSWAVNPGVVTPPDLGVNPLVLNFSATAGGANPASQTVAIVNGGGGSLNWSATVGGTGPAWLSVAPPSGNGDGNLNATVNIAGLAVGTYNRTIDISDAAATGSPKSVSVALTVNPPPPVTIASFDPQSAAAGGGASGRTHALTGVPAGALLVLTTQSRSSTAATVSSSPPLTWTKRVDAQPAAGNAEIWTATFASGGSISVSSEWRVLGALVAQSSVCYVVQNQESTLAGALNSATGQSAPSVAVTTTRANSLLFCVTSQGSNVNGDTHVYRDTATQTHYYRYVLPILNTVTAGYHYYKQTGAIASYTEGISSPTGLTAGTCVLEVRGQ